MLSFFASPLSSSGVISTDQKCIYRCLYNALNDRIRNLLLEYDYSKSTDPLQPLAAHISSLLVHDQPVTTDIVVTADDESLHLHKFILAARSPYFRQKLAASPESSAWRLPSHIPPQAFVAAIKYLYLGEPPRDLKSGPGTGFTESEVFAGIDKISKHLEIQSLLDSILDTGDRRMARQRRTIEISRGRDQVEEWFRENVLRNRVVVETSKADQVKWDRNNAVFADVLLRADDFPEDEDEEVVEASQHGENSPSSPSNTKEHKAQESTLFPCHRAMLLRSEFFKAMFSSGFREAYVPEYLNIIDVDCSSEVLEVVLTFLYTEKADFPLDIAVDVLFAADMLFIEKLKTKAAVVISTLGSGNISQGEAAKTRGKADDDLDIYSIIRAAWLTRVQRLEEFAARYLAYRLEAHVDTPEFAEVIQESASRIKERQETDSIELLDDIRFYLGERFRLRFDDAGLQEMMEREFRQKNADSNTPDEVNKITDGVRALEVPETAERRAENPPISPPKPSEKNQEPGQVIKTLDGEVTADEFSRDAINYQILMDKLEMVLENLNLDA